MESFEQHLSVLGARADCVTALQRSALDTLGYVVIPDLLPSDWLPPLRDLFEKPTEGGDGLGPGEKRESGTRHVGQLDRDELAVRVFTLPAVLACGYYLLKRPFGVCMMHGRDPLPGFGQQGLHRDWHTRAHGTVDIVTGIALLDAFTFSNGATRVVPGTHLNPGRVDKRVADPSYVHAGQVVVEGNPGSVLIFNGHLLHSATRNKTAEQRRTIQFSFVGSEKIRQVMEEPLNLNNLAAEVRFLFGSCGNSNQAALTQPQKR
jgi:hypothetical protein